MIINLSRSGTTYMAFGGSKKRGFMITFIPGKR